MCDYSLQQVASRPAQVGDKLVATNFVNSITRGFAAVGRPNVAVCLVPSTELAFDDYTQYERTFSLFGRVRLHHKVARFRQIDLTDPHAHHDALEFPDGRIVKVTRLVAGQTATVLQLPAVTRDQDRNERAKVSAGELIARTRTIHGCAQRRRLAVVT